MGDPHCMRKFYLQFPMPVTEKYLFLWSLFYTKCLLVCELDKCKTFFYETYQSHITRETNIAMLDRWSLIMLSTLKQSYFQCLSSYRTYISNSFWVFFLLRNVYKLSYLTTKVANHLRFLYFIDLYVWCVFAHSSSTINFFCHCNDIGDYRRLSLFAGNTFRR